MIECADFFDGTSVAPGIEVSGDATIIPTKYSQVIDPTNNGVILFLSRSTGCDINADITIHTSLSTQIHSSLQIPTMLVDQFTVNQNSITQSMDGSITRTAFTLVSDTNVYTGSM